MVQIFLLDVDPWRAVLNYADAHCKLCSDLCQVLCTVLFRWNVYDRVDAITPLWKPAYPNHVITFWASSSFHAAGVVCDYALHLLAEYVKRFGRENAATASIVACCGVIRTMTARASNYKIPETRSCAELVAFAREKRSEDFADRLSKHVFPMNDHGDACVCAFAVTYPGAEDSLNTLLTDALFSLSHVAVSVPPTEQETTPPILKIDPGVPLGIAMHRAYYVCKLVVGMGRNRDPYAWSGDVGIMPALLSPYLRLVLERVFTPLGIEPYPLDGPSRRLPTTYANLPDAPARKRMRIMPTPEAVEKTDLQWQESSPLETILAGT